MSQVILTFVAKNRFCVLNDCRKESNKEWYLEKCRNYQLGISPIKLFETQALLCLWPAFTVVDTNVHDCDTAAWGGPQRIRNSFQFVSRCMFLSPEGRSAGEPGGEKGGECRHCVSTQAQCRLRRRKCAGSVKVVVEVVGIVVQCDKHQRVRCSFEAVHKGLLEGK